MVAVRNRFEAARTDILSTAGDTPVVFTHAAFCVTALPTEPQPDRVWSAQVGPMAVRIAAGAAADNTGWKEFPVPFGRWPRLILMHLCTEAMRTGRAEINTLDNLTAFVTALGVEPNGRLRGDAREQMVAMAVASIRILTPDRTSPDGVGRCDLWTKMDPEDRARWVKDWSAVRLSDEFLRSLQEHAVPMDRRAVKALMHAPMPLDALAWVEYAASVGMQGATPWGDLHRRFGRNYKLVRQFRFAFKHDLEAVQKLCPHLKLGWDDKGVTVRKVTRPVAPVERPIQMSLPL